MLKVSLSMLVIFLNFFAVGPVIFEKDQGSKPSS